MLPLRCLWLLAALAVPLATGAGIAAAHTVLVDSRPQDGASVAEPPTEIVVHFNEPMTPIVVRLLDQAGREVPGITVEAANDTLTIRPAAALSPGGYYLSYRVTSLDAHAVGATLRFGVGAPAPGTVGQPDSSVATLAWVAAVARWLVYLTTLGAAGAALFVLLVRPPEPLATDVRRLAGRLALFGLAAWTLRLGVAGLDLGGLPLRALASLRPWAIASATSLGPASAIATAGLAVIAAGRRASAWELAIASMAIAASFALTGHAATAPPRLLTAPALAVHALCVAFWLGSLLPLLWSLGLSDGQAATVLRRFSRFAVAAVALLVAAGAVLAWVQLGGDVAGIAESTYGQRLLAKLALVAGLLALAMVNRFWLTPAVAAGHPHATRRLRRTLGTDLVLARPYSQ